MSAAVKTRGSAPVGHIQDLNPVEAASVIYLRLWSNGAEGRGKVATDFRNMLGREHGEHVLDAFDRLCKMSTRHGRRPLMRHGLNCACVGADECCFANFVAAAAEGETEDAMLIATLLVRADMAPVLTSLAVEFGLGLKQMRLARSLTIAEQGPTPNRLH